MSDPFNSDYVSSSMTGTSVAFTKSTDTKGEVPWAAASIPSDGDSESSALGFKPDTYGLGKPKRIVIRGKITRE